MFSPTRFDIKWDNVTSIEGTSEERRDRRGRKSTSYYLNFNLKSGGSEKVSVGDLMKKGAAQKLLVVAARKNIPVSGETTYD